jgi:hypothetical protein
MKQKIIDAHTHPAFNDASSIQEAKEAGINFTLNELLKDFKKHNITKAVAIPAEIAQHFVAGNKEIKKLVLEHPEIFIGVCTISPLNYKPGDLPTVEDDIKNGVFKAIKLFPGYEFFYPNQKECEPIYELAQKNKIPVLFHAGDTSSLHSRVKYSHPLNIDDVAVSFPNVNFVICHLGNPWVMDSAELIYKNKNVYADLSGFIVGKENPDHIKYYEDRLRTIMRGIYYSDTNIDKIMFGTDYPLVNYEFYLKFISKLELTKDEFKKLLFENAAKLFKIKC